MAHDASLGLIELNFAVWHHCIIVGLWAPLISVWQMVIIQYRAGLVYDPKLRDPNVYVS